MGPSGPSHPPPTASLDRPMSRVCAGVCREWASSSTTRPGSAGHADTIWAITTPDNDRSQGLMVRLGMPRRLDMDFEHQALPEGDPLRPHVTYEIRRPA